MFWSSQKKIPAPQHQRYSLAKTLYLKRLAADPALDAMARTAGVDPRGFTGEQVFSLGFPEGLIIGMTEHFYALLEKGMDENGVVQTMSGYFGRIALRDGTYPPAVPEGTDFINWLRVFITAGTRGGPQVSDQVLISHFKEVRAFYKR
jgi:hypothetical protein